MSKYVIKSFYLSHSVIAVSGYVYSSFLMPFATL